MSSVLDITISFGTCVIIRRRYVPVNRTGGVIGSYKKNPIKNIYRERQNLWNQAIDWACIKSPLPYVI